jgi:hypothetical protein
MRRLSVLVVVAVVLSALSYAPPVRADTEPSVTECLAATESALTLRKDDQLRAARGQLLICSAASCPVDIRTECLRGIETLNAAIPTVVFSVRTADGVEQSEVKVTMDDDVVADRLRGDALSLEPGIHKFRFELAGHPPRVESIILHTAEKNRPISVVLEDAARTPPVESPKPRALPAATSHRGAAQRTAGFVVGGAGIAALVVGGIFGGLTIAAWNDANNLCRAHTGCSTAALDDGQNAVTYGAVSTATFIVGGVLATGGGVLYFTAPKGPVINVAFGPGSGSLVAHF